jgi:uncharacterized protein (TIGR03435 family)
MSFAPREAFPAMLQRETLACVSVLLALLTASPALAQNTTKNSLTADCAADPQLPAFEVASIRPVASKDSGMTQIGEYGLPRFEMKNVSLALVVSLSFDVRQANFINVPSGLEDAMFDIQVKSAGEVPLTYEALKPRLQQMLEQRFCLKARMGTRQVSGYALVVAKGGSNRSKLTPLKESAGRGTAYMTTDEVGLTGAELSVLAGVLTSVAGKPVEDQTGLLGKYTVKLRFAPEDDPSSTLPSIFTSLKEQLGLELKPARVSVPTLTIDHMNLTPTEN